MGGGVGHCTTNGPGVSDDESMDVDDSDIPDEFEDDAEDIVLGFTEGEQGEQEDEEEDKDKDDSDNDLSPKDREEDDNGEDGDNYDNL